MVEPRSIAGWLDTLKREKRPAFTNQVFQKNSGPRGNFVAYDGGVMARCDLCGENAGWFESRHPVCSVRVENVKTSLQTLIFNGSVAGKAYSELKTEADKLVTENKMHAIGLAPSSTGAPGGKETGQKVSHYIVFAGRFAQAYANLAATGFELRWNSMPLSEERKKKAESKTKYTCSLCGVNAWAKPATQLICGACYEDEGEVEILQEAA